MSGMTDLEQLLATLEPAAREGEYVFVAEPGGAPGLEAAASIREDEGTTLVVRREVADEAGLDYDFVASWITLTVHSSLDAVGLTAAFSGALTRAGISCNVLAGLYHDHILVPTHQRDAALAALRTLSSEQGGSPA